MELPGTDARGTELFQFLKIVEERNGTDLYKLRCFLLAIRYGKEMGPPYCRYVEVSTG
jgi:hypothetical protein